MSEIGIFGGTFSPIHNGHINAANEMYDHLQLDKLYVIPTFIPPHKQTDTGAEPSQRLEMARIAFEGNPRNIEVSDYEISKCGKSYTYLTLRHFTKHRRNITFLCGTDMFLSLDIWKNPNEIFKRARIALMRREDELGNEIAEAKKFYEKKYGARIVFVPSPPVEISSTEIRRHISRGEDISSLVPSSVEEYIKKNRLYGDKI